MQKSYEAPAIRELGSLKDLTKQGLNKIGQSQDMYSTQQNNLVGSIVPAP